MLRLLGLCRATTVGGNPSLCEVWAQTDSYMNEARQLAGPEPHEVRESHKTGAGSPAPARSLRVLSGGRAATHERDHEGPPGACAA